MAIETPTKIGIVSDALVLLGEKPLNTVNDDRYGATVGLSLFELLYENELQSNPWRFAAKKGSLSLFANTPRNEFARAFNLPSDMLLPLGTYPPGMRYEIYATHLYTNASTVDLEYLFKPAVSELPAYFVALLTYALAKDMIKPLTESDTGVRIMTEKYLMQRTRALYADAQGRPNRPIAHSPFTDVR
jgi:hypothetical protein